MSRRSAPDRGSGWRRNGFPFTLAARDANADEIHSSGSSSSATTRHTAVAGPSWRKASSSQPARVGMVGEGGSGPARPPAPAPALSQDPAVEVDLAVAEPTDLAEASRQGGGPRRAQVAIPEREPQLPVAPELRKHPVHVARQALPRPRPGELARHTPHELLCLLVHPLWFHHPPLRSPSTAILLPTTDRPAQGPAGPAPTVPAGMPSACLLSAAARRRPGAARPRRTVSPARH
jgi:hypothetical protein